MNRKLFRTALVGLAGALMLSPMAAAAQVELNNTVLSQNEGWIENGVSYVTLNALAWVVENGIMNGMGDGSFGFKGNNTRAQTGAIMMNFNNNL